MTVKEWRDPVFIGGPSRSGTSMMSRMLRGHPALHVTREAHYFEDLRPRIGAGKLADLSDEARAESIDYFLGMTHRPYGKNGTPGRGWLKRDMLTGALPDDATLDDLFATYCRLWAQREMPEATHWGEKTPRNAFRIDDILTAFPRARILCMVRDPRACVASYRDWQYQGGWGGRERDAAFMEAVEADYRRARLSYHIVTATMIWRGVVNSALAGVEKHGPERVRVLRYENVIADPEAEMRGICDWLGEPFSPDMLDVPLLNSSGSAFAAAAGVSRAPMERWRGKLSDREIHVIERVAGQAMARFDYPPQDVRRNPLDLPLAFASLPFVAARAVWANSSRVSNVPAYAWRRLRAALK